MMLGLLAALLATVTSSYTPASYACDGSTAVFNVSFPYQSQSDLVVTSTTGAGAVTALALTTDYTLSASSTSTTATLTLLSPATKCPSGSTLKIARSMALTQPTSFKSQLNFQPATHETAFDRLAMEIQQVASVGGGSAPPCTYTASGTGALVRTCTQKLGDWLSAADYGTIQQAITAAGTTGAVLIPATYGAGTYTNPNNILVLDLRSSTMGVSGNPAITATGVNGGNAVNATGGGAGYGVYATGGPNAGSYAGAFIASAAGSGAVIALPGATGGIGVQIGAGGALYFGSITFANMTASAASNGYIFFCSDCTIANPCAGSGTGAIAKRLNGVWVCN